MYCKLNISGFSWTHQIYGRAMVHPERIRTMKQWWRKNEYKGRCSIISTTRFINYIESHVIQGWNTHCCSPFLRWCKASDLSVKSSGVVNPLRSRYLSQRGAEIEGWKRRPNHVSRRKAQEEREKNKSRFQPLTFAWFLGTALWLTHGSIRSLGEKYRMWSQPLSLESLLISAGKAQSLISGWA